MYLYDYIFLNFKNLIVCQNTKDYRLSLGEFHIQLQEELYRVGCNPIPALLSTYPVIKQLPQIRENLNDRERQLTL